MRSPAKTHMQNSPSTPNYRADAPQRYTTNYPSYLMRGGLIDVEAQRKAFTAHGLNIGDMGRFYFFALAFDQLLKEGVKGDLAELGVYRGNTASLIATMARCMETTAYLLDTFEGFDPRDITGIDSEHSLEFGDTSLDAVQQLIGNDRVRFVKGRFPESASQIPDDARFCLVHIDCDLYVPIRSALEFFYPRLLPGGYLMIHDYASLCWDGAERAVDEFFADKSECVIPLMDGCGTAVIRKARSQREAENWLIERTLSCFRSDWVSAGGGGLNDLLTDGWSGVEPDRVWGIGATHALQIVLRSPPSGDVTVEADVEAALSAARPSQLVDVVVSGEHLTRWAFSTDSNRGIRRFVVPTRLIIKDKIGNPAMKVEFKPQSVIAFNELDARSKDIRTLGLALFRIRRS